MLRSLNRTELLSGEIRSLIARGDKATAEAEEFYKLAGQRLITLKQQKPQRATWDAYVREMCRISKNRADELIRIYEGRTTLAKVRESNRRKQERFRARQWELRNSREAFILAEARAIRAERLRERKEKVRAKMLASTKPTVFVDRQYPIILADPPWRYATSSGFGDRSPENHYPSMAFEDICAIPVSSIATKDAMLFLWSTNAHLAKATQVIEAWGFEYLSNMVWVKDKMGLGCYVRTQHELLLIARKGKMMAPHPENRPSSVLHSPRMRHSSKPELVYDIIEGMYPTLPKVELFARSKRYGWDAWGNQVNYGVKSPARPSASFLDDTDVASAT